MGDNHDATGHNYNAMGDNHEAITSGPGPARPGPGRTWLSLPVATVDPTPCFSPMPPAP